MNISSLIMLKIDSASWLVEHEQGEMLTITVKAQVSEKQKQSLLSLKSIYIALLNEPAPSSSKNHVFQHVTVM